MTGSVQLFAFTTLAMIAFAGNSVIGRIGMIDGASGPATFALIRLVSGTLLLLAIMALTKRRLAGSWAGAIALLTYAGFFHFAYVTLGAGLGAVILFVTVQIAMISWAILRGERPGALQWLGLIVAMVGFFWLLAPGLESPPLLATALMMIAGIGWAAYSLLGQGSADPIAATTGNFLRASLMAILLTPLALMASPEPVPRLDGIGWAVLSGAITSGLGYVIWYRALADLQATQAAISQLSVPAIAALGGILFLAEPLTLRFTLSTALILVGIAFAILTAPAASPKART